MKASWTLLKHQSAIQILKQDEFFPFPGKESASSPIPELEEQLCHYYSSNRIYQNTASI